MLAVSSHVDPRAVLSIHAQGGSAGRHGA